MLWLALSLVEKFDQLPYQEKIVAAFFSAIVVVVLIVVVWPRDNK